MPFVAERRATDSPWVLAVHGGAGDGIATLNRYRLDVAEQGLAAALRAGSEVLARGGGALEAVVQAVKVLEDAPVFNAGRGSVLTADGTVEMDAAVAGGREGQAGAIAACRGVRHPVEAARGVMEHTDHVLIVGEAVNRLARAWGLELVPEEWFITDEPAHGAPSTGETVGAVARDSEGHLAAATSTGGRPRQLPGRVGDSPIVGAGIWADDATCAISATGHGEAFVLAAFAHEVDALIRLSGLALVDACDRALARVSARGGSGGCIAVDPSGDVAMPFTTRAMFRGWTDPSGQMSIRVLPEA